MSELMNLFTGQNASFASPFEFANKQNKIITSLGLFRSENHDVNKIALDRIVDEKMLKGLERAMHVQSDWNSASLPEFGTFLYQMKYSNSLNSVTSREVEEYRRRGAIVEDSIAAVLSDFSDAQYDQMANTVEADLISALLALKVESQYAGQGDLDFLDMAGATKTGFALDVSSSANVFQQLSQINRVVNVKLGTSLAQQRTGTIILAAGTAADALHYHTSIKDFLLYTMPMGSDANLFTQVQGSNPAYESWMLKGNIVIDVTGYTQITDIIGENGFVVIPKMSDASNAYVLHQGIGTRHATLGKESGLYHQYITTDPQWNYPSIATETAYLPIVNIPDAIVFGGVA